jgi:hypothetical protein
MNTNQFKNFLLVLLFAAVVWMGYKLYMNSSTKEEPKVAAPEVKTFSWKELSKSEIETIVSKEPDAYYEKDLGLSFSEEMDLTGDGKTEAIISGSGGNSSVSFILIRDGEGNISLAKAREKNGELLPVGLYSIGRAQVNAGYKLLPSENGFYVVEMEFDASADNSESSHFKCGENAVNAYAWNADKEWFDWNGALTQKYTAEVCE